MSGFSNAGILARWLATSALGAFTVLSLNGCASVGAATGAVAGAATGLVTANPAIGIGVGIAVQGATDDAVKRYMRSMHTDQQDQMAALAGAMDLGETRPWRVKHRLPLENGHGEVRVTRAFATPLARCKEFVFSVVDGNQPGAAARWYTASACQQDQGWKWAAADPAVERWGSLQ
ncbi:hypothetical protein LJR230_004457 [Trinickia sp. LjRoot230]|uniref:hypothetical protein n=1 Tax=Trinickia sp. LjRoot230 TaxID=3342288 RepID=UPI003ED104BE